MCAVFYWLREVWYNMPSHDIDTEKTIENSLCAAIITSLRPHVNRCASSTIRTELAAHRAIVQAQAHVARA